MDTTEKARSLLIVALGRLDAASPEERSAFPFERIRRELESYLADIDAGRPAHPTGLGRHIVDQWPIDSELGDVILAAEQAYLRYPLT